MAASRARLTADVPRSDASVVAPEVATLLREIVKNVGEAAPPVSGHGDGGVAERKVLLDVQVDGSHYTLIRRHAEPVARQITLSPREREIARLIAKGLPNKAIAAVLDISLWTVATYVRRLFAKLNVNSRAEMVAHVLDDDMLRTTDE